ncbi:hypothetical protein JTB14_026839 [Gonioctena quinquepunctata]|nr:hypothetical protein JTB14_026839 [Gonioctena quinquepunctata]
MAEDEMGINMKIMEGRFLAIKGLSSVEGDGETRGMGLPEVAIQSFDYTNSTEIGDLSVSDHCCSRSEWVANEMILSNEGDAVSKEKRKKFILQSKKIAGMHKETLGELKNINARCQSRDHCRFL